eukprot:CAMPEP_0183354116 /NCGR_PEP_ID=MMETSP0164_2-20130417/36840_1 /TAXON_ID=221442 /ORGANISM="Coccolithus pelagicus ssp braarudi, Strain PLY182g" /LENGTH=64 /DNA_ID=CAMNT_0025526945 /DNA_START=471 /DNA_END=665 /DNA_ORIENTATION=+
MTCERTIVLPRAPRAKNAFDSDRLLALMAITALNHRLARICEGGHAVLVARIEYGAPLKQMPTH